MEYLSRKMMGLGPTEDKGKGRGEEANGVESFLLAALLWPTLIDDINCMFDLSKFEDVPLVVLEASWTILLDRYIHRLPQNLQKGILYELKGPRLFNNVTKDQKVQPNSHIYGTLSDSSDEIRLIVLLPSEEKSSTIRCDHWTTALEKIPHPKYETLSYD
jgi:hypothetical protein